MKVTKLEEFTKAKYKIYLDEQFAFVLYKGEVSRFHIREGESVDAELLEKIEKEILLKRAKLRAMHLLNAMNRTEEQLRKKLAQGLYPDRIIEEALAYVKSFGYINDAAYARNFIETRKDKKSRKEIYALLCQKGLDKEVMEQAFEESYETGDSRRAIEAILRKRKFHPESADRDETRKLMAYLTRKGFGYEDIRQVIQVSEWNA